MTRFDTRLTDPDAKAVQTAIEVAFGAVSKRGIAARISHSKISLKRVSNRTTTEPEGVEFWASRASIATGVAGQVTVAWWTAISGRRYVRVLGRIVTPETGYLVTSSKMNTRPPVWHVFPDRVYRRRAGKANDLVAVCGCGAVGTEKTLGWAGACCGPCFDFQEEHGTLPAQRPALLPMPSACHAVAGSADGRWVAGACAGEVRVWDLDAGAEPVRTFARLAEPPVQGMMGMVFPGYMLSGTAVPTTVGSVPQLALSPDGGYLAVAGRITDGRCVINLRENGTSRATQMRSVEAVAFHPTQDAVYFIAGERVMVASPPEAGARELAIPRVEYGGPLVFSHDGTRLAVRPGEQIRVHETGGKTLATIAFPPATQNRAISVPPPRVGPPLALHVAFSPDGGQIAVGYDQALAVHHAVTGERRFHDGNLPDAVTGIAFDPGGRWLYVGRRDGTLVAHRTDIISNERSVVFRWSLGPIHALARCGDALLAACDEGVQVWPMAKLLEGM